MRIRINRLGSWIRFKVGKGKGKLEQWLGSKGLFTEYAPKKDPFNIDIEI